MGFFNASANQLFITAQDGRRLVCLNGPFSKPYQIPDNATESRLSEKLAKWHMAFFWVLVVSSMIAAALVPGSGWMAAIIFTAWLPVFAIFKLSMRSETRNLTRATERVPLQAYFASVARHQTWLSSLFGFFFCMIFVVIFAAMMRGDNLLLGSIGVAGFGPLCIAWGYIIKRKWEME